MQEAAKNPQRGGDKGHTLNYPNQIKISFSSNKTIMLITLPVVIKKKDMFHFPSLKHRIRYSILVENPINALKKKKNQSRSFARE